MPPKFDVIFVMGPQGSGKGTQAKVLAQKLGFFYWEMGAILRAMTDYVLKSGQTVGEVINQGIYLPDNQITEIVSQKLLEIPKDKGIIFDAIPRRIGQAQFLMHWLDEQGYKNRITLFISLPREKSLERLLLRAKTEKRADDTQEAIERRLKQYEEVTFPILDYMRQQTRFIEIDGIPPISEVTHEIDKVLGLNHISQEKKHIITITGFPGSGKSSTAKEVARRLGYDHFSSGDMFRRMAAERALTIEEINFRAEKQREIDNEVDQLLVELGKTRKNLVIDSHTAFHWTPDSFKVFLNLDAKTRAQRTLEQIQEEGRVSQTGSSVEEILENSRKRTESEQKRFHNLYGIDLADMNNFDLVIDTAANNLEQVIESIITEYQKWLKEPSALHIRASLNGNL